MNRVEKANIVISNENPYFSREYITLDDNWIRDDCKAIKNLRTGNIHKIIEHDTYETSICVHPEVIQFGINGHRDVKYKMLKVENQDKILIGDKIIEVRSYGYEREINILLNV